jgi:outer membrane protein TolC
MTTYALLTHPAELRAASARIDAEALKAYPTAELRAALGRGKDSPDNLAHKARIVAEIRRRGERI